jgi:hypothetical protein
MKYTYIIVHSAQEKSKGSILQISQNTRIINEPSQRPSLDSITELLPIHDGDMTSQETVLEQIGLLQWTGTHLQQEHLV